MAWKEKHASVKNCGPSGPKEKIPPEVTLPKYLEAVLPVYLQFAEVHTDKKKP